MGNAVDHLHGAVFAGLDTGAVAQAAELAGHGAVAADLGSGQAVLQALVVALDLRALGQVSVRVVDLLAGAAHQRNLAGDGFRLDAHDGRHGLRRLVAAGGAFPDGRFALENGFGVSAAAGIAAAAAVGAGKTLVQLIQPGVGFHIENLGRSGQHQAEHQSQTAENRNRNHNFHFFALLRKPSGRRSP